MFNVIDIAKYTVSYYTKMGRPISNLKLQKVLYYLWVAFYRETGLYLYNDRICAWKLGPVVPDVYYEFCPHGSSSINRIFPVKLEEPEQALINPVLDELCDIPAYRLVEKTHQMGTPWSIIFQDGDGDRCPIPFELIASIEC